MSNNSASSVSNVSRRAFVAGSAVIAGACAVASHSLAGTALASEPASGEQSYTPGTYTATATGRRNDITVEVTFDEASIASVNIVEEDESERISDIALERIPLQIVEYQSLGIDTVSGATLTSGAILRAVADCVEQAGGDVAALEAAPGPEKKADVVELECDVAICGAGASGMAAAVAAAQEGAQSVIVIEKASNEGGNCLVSGGYIEYIYPPDELRVPMADGYGELLEQTVQRGRDDGLPTEFLDTIEQEYADYQASGDELLFDSENWYALDYYYRAGGTVDNWVSYAPKTVELNEWLTEIGFEWKPCCAIVGFPWPRQSASTTGVCGQGYFNCFDAYAEKEGLPIQLITETPMTDLIVEDGKVVGVVGTCDDGTTYNIRAAKGVIMATGGYSGNPELLKETNIAWPWDEDTVIPTTNAYGHTGDAIEMAEKVGGCLALADLVPSMNFPYADRKDYSTETIVGDTGNCLLVNCHGERYVDESLSREEIAAALMAQDEPVHYIISDANNCLITDGVTYFGADAQALIDNGQLFRADTIDELARLIGVDATTLVKAVEDYNSYAEAGSDPDFGRTAFTETSPIVEAPFYASPRTWAAHITTAGVLTDDDYRVVTEAGEVVEGLYCVGEARYATAGIACMCGGLECARKMFA